VTVEASRSIEVQDSPAPPRLLLRGVRKQWDKQGPPILDDVDLALDPRAIVLLVGENGVGKTTLLRIVAGLIFADSGEVRVDGLDPRRDRMKYQSALGFLSAGSGGLYARMSARRHLELAARIAFVRGSERGRACNEAIARFGLAEYASRRVDRLSMGQRQRVRLAMVFVHRPKLVLLDEPWNSLDEEGAHVLAEALEAFRYAGGTVICCTPTGAELTAEVGDVDMIIRLRHGRLLSE
jgi:ABC-type multidrug transport system ATPase subunit